MPLRDHFHPPVKHLLPWDTLHSGWATYVATSLNKEWLPPEFLAFQHSHGGGRIEIDVATYERAHGPAPEPTEAVRETNGAAAATRARVYAPPEPAQTMPAIFPDAYEVKIVADGGWSLVAAIEFVSPGNKDRPEARRAFAMKCAAYLRQGVGLLVVDVVTERRTNLHNEIVRLMESADTYLMADEVGLYAVAYRPVFRGEKPEIDLWPAPLALGAPLPTMPLRLTGDLFVPIDLESTYAETCRGYRLT